MVPFIHWVCPYAFAPPGAKLSFGAFRAVRTGGEASFYDRDQGPVLCIQGTAWYISLLIFINLPSTSTISWIGKYTYNRPMDFSWDQMEPHFWGEGIKLEAIKLCAWKFGGGMNKSWPPYVVRREVWKKRPQFLKWKICSIYCIMGT